MQLLFVIKKLIPKKLFKKLRPKYHFFMAWLAAFIYRFPSEKLIVIGVTGTTGKTTTTHLTAKMLENIGFKVGYTSTALLKVGEKEWLNDKRMTMMGRFATQKMLRSMVRERCQYAVVETTSEGIEQFRHRFINYDILIFTGLYPEHIESHGGFENYKKAKGKLFSHLSHCRSKYVGDDKKTVNVKNEIKKIHSERIKKTIIANRDDEHADYFLGFKAEEKYAYHITQSTKHITHDANNTANSDIKIVKAGDVSSGANGVSFKVDDISFNLQLMGEFQAYNAMATVCAGLNQELDLKKISEAMAGITGVPGRFERIDEGQGFTVIVEFAHEPHAVEKFYGIINKMSHNKIIHVLGSAGGGRDTARRPVLGRIAGENADVVIITNEDPYDDDPQIIIDQIALGAEKSGKIENPKEGEEKTLYKIPDRKKAVKKAIELAGEGDIVAITGKGCEQVMWIAGGKKIPSDDRELAREALKQVTSDKLQVTSDE